MWEAIGEGFHKGHGGLVTPKLATGYKWQSWKSMHAVPPKHKPIQSLGYPNPLVLTSGYMAYRPYINGAPISSDM